MWCGNWQKENDMMEKTKFQNTEDFHESILEYIEESLDEILPISLENEFGIRFQNFHVSFVGNKLYYSHDTGGGQFPKGPFQVKDDLVELEADIDVLWLKYLDDCDESGFSWMISSENDNDIQLDIELTGIIEDLEEDIIAAVRNNF